MSGHSKWANIKNKKGAADTKRGAVFTKIGREIAVAVKAGGPDPASNSKLRDAIAKAKAANMPGDNIERSIKKASGELTAVNYEENVYEGYAQEGVAVIVETLTDNTNRTSADIRHIFSKCGGSLGTSGCVSYMFEKKGLIVVDGNGEPLLAFGWELLAEDGDGLPRLDLESRSGEALPAGELSFYMTSAASAEEADTLARGYLENRQTPDPATDDMTTLLAGYRGVSIVDACILNGLDPSLENRGTYAEYFGIENYRGTPEQNLYLLTCMGGVIA